MNKRITLDIAAASIDERTRSHISASSVAQPNNNRTRPISSKTSTMNVDIPPIPQGEDLPLKDE